MHRSGQQWVFGLTDWSRNGSLAEYTAVEARNLAPLAADIDHTVAAALPISGLTARQGLFVHAGLTTGQTVVVHGAAGGVGSIAVQLAREVGAQVIGTGRTDDRDVVLGLGAQAFLDWTPTPWRASAKSTRSSTSSAATSSSGQPRWCAPAGPL